MNSTTVQYLQRRAIDEVRWNQCIAAADNGLIYACSWYLDNMAQQWDALVLGDYQAVMPLPWRKKYGIYYLYQPYFMPALGVFGSAGNPDITGFLQSIPPKFRYWDIDINETCPLSTTLTDHSLYTTRRSNLLLQLHDDYAGVSSRYSRLAKRSLAKAQQHNLTIVRNHPPEHIISLYQKDYHKAHPNITDQDYRSLLNCCNIAAEKHLLHAYTACTPEGEVVAYYLVLHDTRFVYSLIGGSTVKGKTMGAFYLLTDAAIHDHAGSGRVFRFEGSDLPGIAFFNQQFGATPIWYEHLIRNRLPFPLCYFKPHKSGTKA